MSLKKNCRKDYSLKKQQVKNATINDLFLSYLDFLDLFSEENCIEPLMYFYNDFKYVEFILSSDFETAYTLHIKALERIKDTLEEKNKDRMWDLYLIDAQNGYKGSFEEYYKSQIIKSEVDNMTSKEKQEEENRILKNVEKLDNNKFKEVAII